jgi:ADP-heptose:LPS heptosyltransferase
MLSEINKKSKKLIVECDRRLISLYERSFPENIRFIADRNSLSDSEYDSQIAIGSLPKHFRHEREDFKNMSPGWLKADSDQTLVLREKLQAQTKDKIIGISWFTKSAGELSHKRNIPLEVLAKYLKRVPGKYVNLQYGDTAEEILEVNHRVNFELNTVDEIDLFNDIDGLAALISACDIVISIDNLTVHLAGALGVDTRVLLPEVPEERWGVTGSDTYWYDQLTLHRKDNKNGWEQQLECLTQDLLNQGSFSSS